MFEEPIWDGTAQDLIHGPLELEVELGGEGGDDTFDGYITKWVYDETECGAWVDFDNTQVSLGCIIEGSDVEVGPYSLKYPFYPFEFYTLLARVEKEADVLWRKKNDNRRTIQRVIGTERKR